MNEHDKQHRLKELKHLEILLYNIEYLMTDKDLNRAIVLIDELIKETKDTPT